MRGREVGEISHPCLQRSDYIQYPYFQESGQKQRHSFKLKNKWFTPFTITHTHEKFQWGGGEGSRNREGIVLWDNTVPNLSFSSQNSTLEVCHSRCRTLLLLPGVLIPLGGGGSFQPQNAHSISEDCPSILGPVIPVPKPLMWAQKLYGPTCSSKIFCSVMYFSGSHASQLAFLAAIFFYESSSLSHCFQWAVVLLLLVHSFAEH